MSNMQHIFGYRSGVSLSARAVAPVTQDLGWSQIDAPPEDNEPLASAKPQVILYSPNLDRTRRAFLRSSGRISADIWRASSRSFYGTDANGYGIMVWSDR